MHGIVGRDCEGLPCCWLSSLELQVFPVRRAVVKSPTRMVDLLWFKRHGAIIVLEAHSACIHAGYLLFNDTHGVIPLLLMLYRLIGQRNGPLSLALAEPFPHMAQGPQLLERVWWGASINLLQPRPWTITRRIRAFGRNPRQP